MREHEQESGKEVSHTIEKIDAFGTGMSEANRKIANTFSILADKPTVVQPEGVEVLKDGNCKKAVAGTKKLLEAVKEKSKER